MANPSNLCLYFPHAGEPVYRKGFPEGFIGDDYLVISPNLTVLYNNFQDTPNAALAKLGYNLSNISGDAVIVYDEDREKDIPEDTLEKLPEILKEDTRRRREVCRSLTNSGAQVITI